MDNPIGILDSGIGGVTVLREILKLLPNEKYIYYSDSLHNPYGKKNKNEVYKYIDEIMHYFIERNCKAVVFACNTATALAINDIRDKYKDMIIIGIEPAYKMVHDYAENKKTLVMATKATIDSKKFLELYHNYDNNNTKLLACPNLASLIEEGDSEEIDSYLTSILPKEKFDVIVLGCTHYPLIKDKIKKILGDVIFYDGSVGVAKRLYELLSKNNLLSTTNGSINFYDSSNEIDKEKRFFTLLKLTD